MKQPESYEHQYTEEIVCPYCGTKFNDSWEHMRDEGDGASENLECDECGKGFDVEKHIEVTYCTYTNEDDCEHEGTIYCDKCRAKLPENTKKDEDFI